MASNQPTPLCRYRYDALDRLIHHSQAEMPTQQHFYCQNRLTTEINGAMRHSIFQQGDQLLAQQQRHGDDLSCTLLATDLQRSVLATLDNNHQQLDIAYTPYGHRHPKNGLLSLLGFNGEQPDPVTSHYLLGNGYRAFNPVLMRFNSPDSLSPFDEGGLNAYTYVLGNPVGRVDPTGHFSVPNAAFLSFVGTVGIGLVGGGLGIGGVLTGNEQLAYVGVGLIGAGLFGQVGSNFFSSRSTPKIRNIQSLFPDNKRVGIGEQNISFLKGGGKRLVIQGHGTGKTVGKYKPAELAQGIEEKYPQYKERFKYVRLLSCHAADAGANSYASALSELLNMPVKANKGAIRLHGPRNVIENSSSKSTRLRIDKKTITHKGTRYKYSPHTFIPDIRKS
jgi:RHS repeat-associated protein